MSQVVDIRNADDPRDVIHQTVQALADGTIVGLPTETGYTLAVSALKKNAVQKLGELLSDTKISNAQLTLKSSHEVNDYVTNLSRLESKLARRCWPGPVTIRLHVEPQQGLFEALSPETRSVIVDDQRCGFRVPAHEMIHEVLRLSPGPLVLATEHGNNGTATMVRQADQLAQTYDESLVPVILDDGPSQYDQPATVVEVTNGRWSCVKPGVVNETMIGRLASEVYLFVCTGNTCRSPMAEGWFRKLLAEHLNCREDELVDNGYIITSAGLAAGPGMPASPEAVSLTDEHGVDLHSHESKPLTDQLLNQADHIFTMTRGHRDSILSIRPDMAEMVHLLATDGGDVPDPIGFGFEEYQRCEKAIEQFVREIISQVPPNETPRS